MDGIQAIQIGNEIDVEHAIMHIMLMNVGQNSPSRNRPVKPPVVNILIYLSEYYY